MSGEDAVFQETLWGKVVRETSYDRVTHFISGDKFTTVHRTDGQELVVLYPLKALALAHPELIYIHRSTLVKPKLIESLLRADTGFMYWAVMRDGTRLQVSRRYVPAVRALLKITKEEHRVMTREKVRNPVFYGQGRRARGKHFPKTNNPYPRNSPAASWWLAGWNDTDIEAKNL